MMEDILSKGVYVGFMPGGAFRGVRRMPSYHRFRQLIGPWHFENTLHDHPM